MSEARPLAVIRYGNGRRSHDEDAPLIRSLLDRGWGVVRKLPLHGLEPGSKYNGDPVADLLDLGDTETVLSYLRHEYHDDPVYDLWGGPEANDLARLWNAGLYPEFYRRLAATVMAAKQVGTTPILDHTGAGATHPAIEPWVAMWRAAGMEPIREPWEEDHGGGFCLERWFFGNMIRGEQPDAYLNEIGIRWFSAHRMPPNAMGNEALPWMGRRDWWLQHCLSHGHTPAFKFEDIDTTITAAEYLDEVRDGKHNKQEAP
jgi:hypothetical protein